MTKRFYEFGPFRIDKVNHVLLRDGKVLPLKPKVFDTLMVLVEARDRVLDKDEMMRQLWPDAVVEESNLSQNIYLLRKVLGEADHGGVFIETIPKRGYRFVASISEADDVIANAHSTPFSLTQSEEVVSRPRPTPVYEQGRGMKLVAAALGLAIVGALASIAVSYLRNRDDSEPKTVSGTPVKSIAILPFKPLNADPSDEALGLGMADTLIIRLSNFRQLEVRGLNSVRQAALSNYEPSAAGRQLKVDAILDGTIQRDGDHIRVGLRLIRVSDGSVLWAGSIDEAEGANDFLGIQDRISERVARELVTQMTGEQKNLLVKRYTQNTEAYRLYVNGRYHWNKADVEGWQKAIEYFNRAIAKDPNYALAYTGLADSYLSIVADELLPKAETIPKAKQAAMMALRLDDSLSEAHTSLGRIHAYHDWDWSKAEVEFKRALELDPNSAIAHREYAGYLTTVGRTDQAIAEAKHARELDPVSVTTNFAVQWALIAAHRYDEAIAQSQEMLSTFPGAAHYWMGLGYLGKNQYEEAIGEFEKRLRITKDDARVRAHLGYAYGRLGKNQQARRILAELQQPSGRRSDLPYCLAIIHSGLGEKDQAFASLEVAFNERSRLLWGLKANPAWDNLRSDLRFAGLLHRMGLPE